MEGIFAMVLTFLIFEIGDHVLDNANRDIVSDYERPWEERCKAVRRNNWICGAIIFGSTGFVWWMAF